MSEGYALDCIFPLLLALRIEMVPVHKISGSSRCLFTASRGQKNVVKFVTLIIPGWERRHSCGMDLNAAPRRVPQNNLHDVSRSSGVGFGRRLILFSTSCLNLAQVASRKFYLFTGLFGMGLSVGLYAGMMSEGLC